MSTPVHEITEPTMTPVNRSRKNSDDEGILSAEPKPLHTIPGNKDRSRPPDYDHPENPQEFLAGVTSQSREQEHRLNDDLAMLQAERVVSSLNERLSEDPNNLSHSTSMGRTRSRPEPIDQFEANTNPIHEKTAGFAPPEHPTVRLFRASHFILQRYAYPTAEH